MYLIINLCIFQKSKCKTYIVYVIFSEIGERMWLFFLKWKKVPVKEKVFIGLNNRNGDSWLACKSDLDQAFLVDSTEWRFVIG